MDTSTVEDQGKTPADGIKVATNDAGSITIAQVKKGEEECVVTVPPGAAQAVAYAVLKAATPRAEQKKMK